MRAKLVKTENGYGLEDCGIIAFYSKNRPVHKHYKLSKENCDEIFSVVDVNDIYKEVMNEFDGDINSFTEAFAKQCIKKTIVSNKDKLFSLENMFDLYAHILKNGVISGVDAYDFIKSLQKPRDIEIEVVTHEVVEVYRDGTINNILVPKLDEKGCLILRML